MLLYLLESGFCLACLYAFYLLALRRETFFQANRLYLVLAPAFSLLAPAIQVKLAVEPLPAQKTTIIAYVPQAMHRVQTAVPDAVNEALARPLWAFSVGDVAWGLYLAVAGLLALRLLVQLIRMMRYLLRARSRNATADGIPVASFFGFIIWAPQAEAGAARRLMWEHELVHVRQWHSLDVVLLEALIVVQWFNPLLYLYRRSLREVHEFIADEVVVRRTGSRRAYAELLVSQTCRQAAAAPRRLVNHLSFTAQTPFKNAG
jgi:hypothetical protein